MIIWSGWGFLVAVIVFGCSLLMELITENITGDEDFYQESGWAFPASLVIAGAFTFICDRLISPKDANRNTLFFISMRWWAPILFVIALGVFIFKIATSGAAA